MKPHDWRVAEREPVPRPTASSRPGFTFETEVGRGYGLVRIRDGLIWTLLTTLVELKGFEEKAGFTRPLGAKHGVNPGAKTWKETRDERNRTLGYEKQPYVRDHRRRPGRHRARRAAAPARRARPSSSRRTSAPATSWRNRYKSLCLHDPVWYDHLPYLKFPKNWPVFSPKDKIARLARDVHQGDGAQLLDRDRGQDPPAYDEAKKEWTVVVDRDGKEVVLRPKQLVFATGMSGKPNLPNFKGMETFKGDQHHSSQHPGPDAYKGKKVRRDRLQQFGARHLRRRSRRTAPT